MIVDMNNSAYRKCYPGERVWAGVPKQRGQTVAPPAGWHRVVDEGGYEIYEHVLTACEPSTYSFSLINRLT